jgi:hypothetical protein
VRAITILREREWACLKRASQQLTVEKNNPLSTATQVV